MAAKKKAKKVAKKSPVKKARSAASVKEPKPTVAEKVDIPPLSLKYATITIVGISPLMVHQFNEKSKKQIQDKQEGKAKQTQAFRDKNQEYREALYMMGKTKTGIPAAGLKHAAVNACTFVGDMKKTHARGAFHVLEEENGLVSIKGKHVLDERMVRIGNFGSKVATPRYRPRYDKWEITFKVVYNDRMITPEQLLNLYENAGFAIGLCEHRPEKNGNLGMFKVKRA